MSRVENQQTQTPATYGVKSDIQTRATLVEGEYSQQPCPPNNNYKTTTTTTTTTTTRFLNHYIIYNHGKINTICTAASMTDESRRYHLAFVDLKDAV